MIDFFIKSILSLGILYVFYLVFLSRLKTFHFNRYFLLGSLVFSLIIPFVSIPVDNTALPFIQSTGNLSISSTIENSGEFIASKEVKQNAIISYLPYLYGIISFILFLRFSVNLFNIIKTIINNQKIKKEGYSIVLLSNQIIPYSFFRYVLVNKNQYRNGKIDEALIQHEMTHCKQWHSFDILFVELLKVLFWINPFIWLIKKGVQLNHEFLADDSVLSNHDLTNYRNLLVNLILKHNDGVLTSNFNFSLTKQRLKMMTKQFSPQRAIFGKSMAIVTFFLLTVAISCNQEPIEGQLALDVNENWWKPILEAHNVEPLAYNNFEGVFEMGTTNSINDDIVTLKDAFILIKRDSGYLMLQSPLAYHDINGKTITAEIGIIDSYKMNHNSDLLHEAEKVVHSAYNKLQLQLNGDKMNYKAENMTWDIVNYKN